MGTLCFHSQLSPLVFFCAPLISPLPFTLPIPPLLSPLPFTLFIPPHFSLLLHFNSSSLHISQPFIPPLPSSSLLFPSLISPFLVSLCLLSPSVLSSSLLSSLLSLLHSPSLLLSSFLFSHLSIPPLHFTFSMTQLPAPQTPPPETNVPLLVCETLLSWNKPWLRRRIQ